MVVLFIGYIGTILQLIGWEEKVKSYLSDIEETDACCHKFGDIEKKWYMWHLSGIEKSDTCCLSDIEESDSDVVTSLKRLEHSVYDSAVVWLQWPLKNSAF